MENAVYMAILDDRAYIRAIGHVRAQHCNELRNRIERLGADIHSVVFDLAACTYMDSTFIGLIVNANRILSSHGNHGVMITRLPEVCKKLLATLGVLPLLELVSWDVPFPASLECISGDTKQPSAELLLKTHEFLMELSDENRDRFSMLHTILKQQMKKGDS